MRSFGAYNLYVWKSNWLGLKVSQLINDTLQVVCNYLNIIFTLTYRNRTNLNCVV